EPLHDACCHVLIFPNNKKGIAPCGRRSRRRVMNREEVREARKLSRTAATQLENRDGTILPIRGDGKHYLAAEGFQAA
ncbi:MAG TPA: hypothetical protein PLL19_04575, partial [Thiobacillaceae bacterium]|nr:hypothetical protein [Thiobacillaceae bacterium]HNI08331.1 hypothetical protein [Thiobacillaceae bacterium]